MSREEDGDEEEDDDEEERRRRRKDVLQVDLKAEDRSVFCRKGKCWHKHICVCNKYTHTHQISFLFPHTPITTLALSPRDDSPRI